MYIELQGDGTDGNRLFDGTVDQDTFDLHGTISYSGVLLEPDSLPRLNIL